MMYSHCLLLFVLSFTAYNSEAIKSRLLLQSQTVISYDNLCISGTTWPYGADPNILNGGYYKGNVLINEQPFYGKNTNIGQSSDVIIYSFNNQWFITTGGMPIGSNPFEFHGDGNIHTDSTLGLCQTSNIDIIQCTSWWPISISIISGNCNTPSPTMPPTLSGTEILTLSQQQKNEILGQANNYRSQIALGHVKGSNNIFLPTAAKMSPLIWDDKLAEGSQNWANQCKQVHAPADEGLAWSHTNNLIETAISMFYSEVKDYSWGYRMDEHGVTGHFWGLIHENHVKFGCGYAKCPNNFNAPYWMVCRYEANGHLSQDYPYTPSNTGIPGSQCSKGVNSATGLCIL